MLDQRARHHRTPGQNQVNLTALLMTLLLVFVMLFPGCKSTPTELIHLKVGLLPFMSASPFYLAYEAGYFTKQGIDVEFVKFTSAAQLPPLLAQGQLDVYGASMTPALINGVAQGLDIKIVAGREYNAGDGVSSALVVRKDLYDSGELNTVAKLKGRKIAILSVGSISHFTLSKILATANLTLKDVQIATETSSSALAAFENHALEASTMGPPELQRGVSLGYTVILDSLNRIMPGFQSGFVVYGPNLLEKNPEAGKKFMVAYLQGVQLYNMGKTARNMEVIGKYLAMDQAALNEAYWTPIYADGRIITADVLEWQNFYKENNLVDKAVGIGDMTNTTFLEYAVKIVKPQN
jgi:NitT/TauT family transport system substrate-binding protein